MRMAMSYAIAVSISDYQKARGEKPRKVELYGSEWNRLASELDLYRPGNGPNVTATAMHGVPVVWGGGSRRSRKGNYHPDDMLIPDFVKICTHQGMMSDHALDASKKRVLGASFMADIKTVGQLKDDIESGEFAYRPNIGNKTAFWAWKNLTDEPLNLGLRGEGWKPR